MTPFPKILLAAAAALVSVTAVHAADVKYLADRHVARGMTCEMCHTKDMKVKPSTKYEDLDVCTDCHGDYAAMIKKTVLPIFLYWAILFAYYLLLLGIL